MPAMESLADLLSTGATAARTAPGRWLVHLRLVQREVVVLAVRSGAHQHRSALQTNAVN